jgi:hypothetical protein
MPAAPGAGLTGVCSPDAEAQRTPSTTLRVVPLPLRGRINAPHPALSPLARGEGSHILSGASIPSRPSAVSSWFRVAADSASREARVAASAAASTGQAW